MESDALHNFWPTTSIADLDVRSSSVTQNCDEAKEIMMKAKLRVVSMVTLGVAVLFVSVGYLALEKRQAAESVDGVASEASANALPKGGGAADSKQYRAPVTSRDVDDRAAGQASHPFSELPASRRGMPLGSDPFMAKSVAEQEWLDRNGYPNEVQWGVLTQASDLQLQQAALAGDKVAQVLLNQRKIAAGDVAAIEDTLVLGAMGSGFALEILAATLAGPLQDPVGGYAMVRAGEMRGNYRSGPAREVLFSVPLTSLQRTEGETEALESFRQLAAIRASRGGGNVPPVDPRPIDP